ncbi:MAG: hypothetical protein Tsb0013_10070 [Phycisphaerales bacterium]
MTRWTATAIVCAAVACGHAHGQQTRDETVAALIEDLRDDDVRWNADRAMDALVRMRPAPVAALEAVLDSEDWQQRQLACQVLWRLYDGRYYPSREAGAPPENPNGVELSDRLLEVSVEALRDDEMPYGPRGNAMLHNAKWCYFRLVTHAERAKAHLRRGLSSDDPQQRLLCALALGNGGVSECVDEVLPILLPHLEDNDIEKDACWCVRAIYRMGDAALVALVRAREVATDRQQRDLLELLILNLSGPPETRRELEARRRLNTITDTVHDPTLDGPRGGVWWLDQLRR